jgi:hypothetical protein
VRRNIADCTTIPQEGCTTTARARSIAAMVVRGKIGNIGGSGISKLINQGLISADVAAGILFVRTGQFDNAGTIESKNGSSLTIDSSNWNNTGRIEASGGGTLTLGGNWSNRGTINANEATVNLGGTFGLPIKIPPAARSREATVPSHEGTWSLNGGAPIVVRTPLVQ